MVDQESLPLFVRDLLAGVPRHGEGVHNWLFRVARVLHPFRGENDIRAILQAATAECGRIVSVHEIENAIQHAKPFAWRPGLPLVGKPFHTTAWPSVDRSRRDQLISAGPALVDLWELSPWRLENNTGLTEEIIDMLFPPDCLLCAGQNTCHFDTRRRSDWRGLLEQLSLVVPSPMLTISGKTRDGRDSKHALSNTGPRRFLVVEFDSGTIDEHAALLFHLAQRAPLAVALHSGHKSLHGWFYCAHEREERLERFMRCACSVGADRATWTRSQFVRMPDGTRENGKRQRVYYLNPGVIR